MKKQNDLKLRVIPPLNVLLKEPLIGSGKLSRRITVKPFKFKNGKMGKWEKNISYTNMFHSKNNYFPTSGLRKNTSKPINFETSSARIIFYYWNNIGHPFIHHRPELNKTTSIALERINKNFKKYGKEKILFSIDLLSKVFNADWFKYRILFSKRKISLPDFFRYDKNKMSFFNKNDSGIPVSWFQECLRGESYLSEKYTIKIKDKYPDITKRIKAIWKEFIKYDKINTGDINQFVLCSKKLFSFGEKNKIDCLVLIDLIDGMLNRAKDFKPKHAGYLSNKIFWEQQIPNELVRTNLVLDRSKLIL